ncbi:hypothetical protein ACP70R_042476 [Stipagrostis hirtigluma subsp. patula]
MIFVIPMAGLLTVAIALAVGGAAEGGPSVLGLLLAAVTGRNPAVGVIAAVLVICAYVAFSIGVILLARCDGAAVELDAAAPAPATERFAAVALTVALAVVFSVAAGLLAILPAPAGALWST